MDTCVLLGAFLLMLHHFRERDRERDRRRRRLRRRRVYPVHVVRPVPTVRPPRRERFSMIYGDLLRDPQKFRDYLKMSIDCFQGLLEIVSDQLRREDTVFRSSIPPCKRLVVTLRYLATGSSFSSLQYEFRIGESTISRMVVHTCRVLWAALKDKVMPACDQARWLEVADLFWKRRDFPNCVGAIDGKRIRLVSQPPSGSENYKQYFSIVLMAVVDADYNLICVDVGNYGSASDSAVFQHSVFDLKLDLPEPRPLPGTSEPKMPMVFVGEEEFNISKNLMCPYSEDESDQKKSIFNYRLCRVRSAVECTFGFLANKWNVLHTPISLRLEDAIEAVKATCVLHNYVKAKDGYEFEDILVPFLPAFSWPVPCVPTSAFTVRDTFADYFVSKKGEVEWQYK